MGDLRFMPCSIYATFIVYGSDDINCYWVNQKNMIEHILESEWQVWSGLGVCRAKGRQSQDHFILFLF